MAHVQIVLSDEAAAIICPSGENLTSRISAWCASLSAMMGDARLLVRFTDRTSPLDLAPSLDMATCCVDPLPLSSCRARLMSVLPAAPLARGGDLRLSAIATVRSAKCQVTWLPQTRKDSGRQQGCCVACNPRPSKRAGGASHAESPRWTSWPLAQSTRHRCTRYGRCPRALFDAGPVAAV